MTTSKQLEANRKNAELSTGPITNDGIKKSSMNSLRHGILSKEVVISTPELNETQDEYDEIVNRLIGDYEPVGLVEEMLIEKIATSYWRMRRLCRAEKGAIQERCHDKVFRENVERIKKSNEYKEYPMTSTYTEKLLNSASASWVKSEFIEMKKTVEELGYMPDELFNKYVDIKGIWKSEEGFKWVLLFNVMAKKPMEPGDAEKGKKALLFSLSKDIEHASLSYDVAIELEGKDTEAKILQSGIPDTDSLERFQRYETMLENQLYRAINQLLKLQAVRKGGKAISFQAAEIDGVEFP